MLPSQSGAELLFSQLLFSSSIRFILLGLSFRFLHLSHLLAVGKKITQIYLKIISLLFRLSLVELLLLLLLEVDATRANITDATLHARQVYTRVFVSPSIRD